MNKFEMLKTTYPKSKINRKCDAYEFILNNFSENKRTELGIVVDDLQKSINVGETYMYRVGKENGKFKAFCFSLKNFEILRKHYFQFND